MNLTERIKTLTVSQRRALADRLAALAPEYTTRAEQLIAFCTASSGSDRCDTGSVLDHLRQSLPEYMVPARIVWVDEMPRTANGKVNRTALGALEVSGPDTEADRPHSPLRSADSTDREDHGIGQELARIFARVLGLPTVGLDQDFFALGGDSLMVLRVLVEARERGIEITPADCFRNPTAASLARVARAESSGAVTCAAKPTPPSIAERDVAQPVPLTPIQSWFFGLKSPRPHHFNLSLGFEMGEPLDAAAFTAAVQAIDRRHDAFRLRYERDAAGEWTQHLVSTNGGVAATKIDLASGNSETPDLDSLARALQGSLDIHHGPVARFVAIDRGDRLPLLWVIAHHLVVDGVSLRSLLLEFQRLYGGEKLTTQPSPLSPIANSIAAAAHDRQLDADAAFWLGIPAPTIQPLPRDHETGFGNEGEAQRLRTALDAARTTELLTRVHEAYNTRIDDLLRTALLRVVTSWTREPTLWLDVEGHGRRGDPDLGIEPCDAVGWLTTLAPILLSRSSGDGIAEDLLAVKEIGRALPRGGASFGMLRYLRDDAIADRLAALPQPEIYLNYLGQFDQVISGDVFRAIDDRSRFRRHERTPRTHLFEINAWVVDGRLEVEWAHGPAHGITTVQSLADGFLREIRELVDHCLDADAGGYSPSDFPDASLSQEELRDILDEIGDE